VVVIGAGFGGLACTRRLAGAPVDVVLVDRHNYHLFTPLLYQVASALLNPSEVAIPVRSILGQSGARFRMADVTGIDPERRLVLTRDGPIAYDWLVIAVGSQTAYFGKDGVRRSSFGVKVLPDALALRNRILGQLEAASRMGDPVARRRALTFVVVGGGPTGVEYAGALVELFRLVVGRDFPDLAPEELEVTLVEMGDRLLAEFPVALSEYARRRLERLGVNVRTGTAVEEYGDGGRVRLRGGAAIETDTLIWAAGVRPTRLAETVPFARARSGRLEIDEFLRVRGEKRVFAIGDVAQVEQDGRPLPQMAPPAMQAGRQVADNILRALRGEAMVPFRYRDKGIMAVIGRNAGVARIGGLDLKGFVGWAGWLFVHLYYLIGFRNRLAVLARWAWYYLLYDRPIRIIARARVPDGATPIPPDDG
jgi:NADH dehydrogenase